MPGKRPLPFSEAVLVGDMLYLSGQLGTDSTGRLVAGGIKAETRQAMDNIRDVLGRVGSSMDRIVKCTVMLADMAEWPAMNAVYATYFPRQFPARSAFGTTGLALGARVEIEAMRMMVLKAAKAMEQHIHTMVEAFFPITHLDDATASAGTKASGPIASSSHSSSARAVAVMSVAIKMPMPADSAMNPSPTMIIVDSKV